MSVFNLGDGWPGMAVAVLEWYCELICSGVEF
jgi:hypothetical protein